MKKLLCIYHANCNDGFAAALAVKMYCDREGVEFASQPANYGDAPPVVEGYATVAIVDFSYPRDILLQLHTTLLEDDGQLILLDHHKTAEADCKDLPFPHVFDMEKSGAVLAWEYFHPGEPVPDLLLHVQDRDLWQWKLPGTKEILSGLKLLGYDFDLWQECLEHTAGLFDEGLTVLAYERGKVKAIVEADTTPFAHINGDYVPCLNLTTLISETLHGLIERYPGVPFVASYFETGADRIYSLRSGEKGADVSAVAKKYGGGGHKHAAGFKLPVPSIVL